MLLNWIVVSKDCETLFPVLATLPFRCCARWTATGSHLFVILEVFYSCCHLLWLFAVANSDTTAPDSDRLIVGFSLFFCCHHRGFLRHCCHRCAHAEILLVVYFSFSCCRHCSVHVANGGATVVAWWFSFLKCCCGHFAFWSGTAGTYCICPEWRLIVALFRNFLLFLL